MSSDEPFGPWAEAMERAGARNPRSAEGSPSWGGLARLAGLSTSAVTNLVHGRTRRPNPETVQKIAGALGVAPEVVSGWLDMPRPVGASYAPAAEASLLYEHERDALDELIRAITRGRREAGGGDAERAASKTQAPVSGADDAELAEGAPTGAQEGSGGATTEASSARIGRVRSGSGQVPSRPAHGASPARARGARGTKGGGRS